VRLADGRCPLLRATLSSLEPQLACRELVRVHRSWIVNPRHVTAIETLPSGDRRLTLAGGRTAPASRRYLEAINRVVGACEALGGAVA
jgi:DNA-binding LytR/AlgR family response regulator